MSDDEPQMERTDADEEESVQPPPGSQDELNRTSRATGGDAPAAASIEEREAVAVDQDELFSDERSDTQRGGVAQPVSARQEFLRLARAA